MDKVADFYNRWFAMKRVPDYSGAEAGCEELAKHLVGVYESTSEISGKVALSNSCAERSCICVPKHICMKKSE
jgi:hypothetical protein